jgi:hypothetical protein
MSLSMADTAELPRVDPPPLAVVSPEEDPAMPEWLEVAAPPGSAGDAPAPATVCDLPAPPRAMLRVERRRERRQRVWWVAAGLAAMVAMFGVTVAVLSKVR